MDTLGVAVILVENGISDPCSTLGRDCLRFPAR